MCRPPKPRPKRLRAASAKAAPEVTEEKFKHQLRYSILFDAQALLGLGWLLLMIGLLTLALMGARNG